MANNKLTHSDHATLKDAFSHDTFIKQICEEIKTCEMPKGISINGYWGSGKTSALAQVCYHLSKEKVAYVEKEPDIPDALYCDDTVIPVWFEAWRHQHEPQPIVVLLHEIRTQMGLWQKLQQKSKKIANVALLGAISAFDEAIKVASGGIVSSKLIGEINDSGSRYEKERYQQPLTSEAMHKLLEAAVDNALGNTRQSKKKKRLVIFVDDLDRCNPVIALRLLEGIKIFLNIDNCVVVYGMDHRQIERALFQALPGIVDDDDREYYAREYLEKICQDNYQLPVLTQEEKKTYFCNLLFALLDTLLLTHRSELEKILETYNCLPSNPRKIKILANRVSLLLRSHSIDNEERFATSDVSKAHSVALILAIIYCYHRSIYEQLDKTPEYIETVIQFAASSADITEIVEDPRFIPMKGIKRSVGSDGIEIPSNPSDSNVFRLHQLLLDIQGNLTSQDISPFLGI